MVGFGGFRFGVGFGGVDGFVGFRCLLDVGLAGLFLLRLWVCVCLPCF